MRSIAKFIAKFIAVLWTIAIVALTAFTWQQFYEVNVADAAKGITCRVVTTDSMVPTYNVGDRVCYVEVDPKGNDLQPGRALLIDNNGDFYTHRVVSVDPVTGEATMRGDNREQSDLFKPTQAQVEGIPFFVEKDELRLWMYDQLEDRRVIGLITLLAVATGIAWSIRKAVMDSRDKRIHDALNARIALIDDALVADGTIPPTTSSASTAEAELPAKDTQ